jgi:hypothetical protein
MIHLSTVDRGDMFPYTAAPRRGKRLKDEVHIRNAEAAQLARVLARQTG